MAVTAIQEWLQAGHADPGNPVQRQLLVISGSADNCYERTEKLLCTLPPTLSSCWVGPENRGATLHTEIQHARLLLGQEFDVAVYDAHQPFRPSALMALAGTIKRGGRLILLTPDLTTWHLTPTVLDTHYVSYGYELGNSPYLKRLQTQLLDPRYCDTVAYWQPHAIHLPIASGTLQTTQIPAPFLTEDQARVFTKAKQQLDKADACVVLTAPRGRGKSALLGLLAADLIQQGKDVSLTSPVSNNTQAIFDIAQHHCNGLRSGNRSPELTSPTGGGRLQWFAPDHPRLTLHQHHYLIVDEAASLPLPVLRKIVASADRLILATTTQGYEGSGQGFLNRFLPFLDQLKELTHYSLSTPIRWLNDDPLEQFCEASLLFAENEKQPPVMSATQDILWSTEAFDSLSERHFREAIQLLTSAHYQTTPDDIMRIVDAPDTFLVLATTADTIVAVCIVTREGGARLTSLAAQISSGERRVRGHLGAQRLALLSGSPALASLSYWRINRIAVAPALQGQGIGSDCLRYINDIAKAHDIDALSSSFGATSRLLNFWCINDFEQIAAGRKPDKSSGERSALVLQPLTRKMIRHMSYLKRIYRYDTSQLDIRLLITPATDDDLKCIGVIFRRLNDFSWGSRSFDQLGIAWNYFIMLDKSNLTRQLSAGMDLQGVSQVLALSGKKEAKNTLQNAVTHFLESLEIKKPPEGGLFD